MAVTRERHQESARRIERQVRKIGETRACSTPEPDPNQGPRSRDVVTRQPQESAYTRKIHLGCPRRDVLRATEATSIHSYLGLERARARKASVLIDAGLFVFLPPTDHPPLCEGLSSALRSISLTL